MARKPKQNYSAKTALLKDNCQTPPYAVDLLMPFLDVFRDIWEPAAGDGLLARRLREHGRRVYTSDILDGESDFFRPDHPTVPPSHVNWMLVTNPPFSMKYAWLKRCYELRKPFALLMPTDAICAGRDAQPLFKLHGIEIVIPSRRINFKMPFKAWRGHSPVHTSWFTWGMNIGQRITFVEMERWKPERVEAWEQSAANG